MLQIKYKRRGGGGGLSFNVSPWWGGCTFLLFISDIRKPESKQSPSSTQAMHLPPAHLTAPIDLLHGGGIDEWVNGRWMEGLIDG